MNSPVKVYHELRKVSPEKARMLVRNILEKTTVMYLKLLVSWVYHIIL